MNWRRLSIRIAAWCFCLVSIASVGSAQAVDSGGNCFRGRPLPECRSFWITELGYFRTSLSTESPTTANPSGEATLKSHTAAALGVMRNRSANRADGYTAEIGFNNRGIRVAGSRRYRFWMPSQQQVDVSAGAVHTGVRGITRGKAPGNGLTADVSYGWADLFGGTLRADVVRAEKHTFGAVYTGVKVGSYSTLLTAVAGILSIGILALLLSGETT
jgi:hypothetical protein